MTGRGQFLVLGVMVACCVGNALLLAGVLAGGGALTGSPWLVTAAGAVAAVALWQTTVAMRRRQERS